MLIMDFSKFTIEDFRAYLDKQTLNFAIPDGESEGSGLTYIVGENNVGKTTLLEAIQVSEGDKIRNSDYHGDGPEFCIFDADDTLVRKCSFIRESSYTIKENPKLSLNHSFEFIPARKFWRSQVDENLRDEDFYRKRSQLRKLRDRVNTNDITNLLAKIEIDQTKYRSFISYVQRVVPHFSEFAVGYEEKEFLEYRTKNGDRHKSDMLGDGIISIIRTLAFLFKGSKRPLVIDEPELSLHPLAQKKLLKVIGEQAKNRQIIICTHSPYFVSWKYFENGASINKVVKHDDRKSEINTLNDYSTYSNLISGSNWQQPFLMDIVAKDIFFNENFLFVEGQEDVGLLSKYGDIDSSINLFGYGVRGSGAFKFSLELANDLGIQKAAVLLDAGDDETKIKNELEDKFPNYKIIQWNKNDIRDKAAPNPSKFKKKSGYFTKHGKKKPEPELDDYQEKINSINNYFLVNE